jgi:diguanylate cyclase (GGDEF)-like protein/PAS domain S-box-containing protein
MFESSLTILLIDDDEDDCFITGEILGDMLSLKVGLDWANNVSAAYQKLAEKHYDLVFVDYRLGATTGIEILRELKKVQDTPVILLTGQGTPELEQKAITLGAQDYLIKGQFNADQLQRTIVYSIERHRSQQNLELYKRALDSSYNGIVIADATKVDLPIIYANKSFERITGYALEEVVGRNCRFLQGDIKDEKANALIRSALQEKRECHVILRNLRKDGSMFWNNLFLAPVPDERGNIQYYIGVQNDISDQKKYEAQLEYNANHDALTGLPNRVLLEDRLTQSCQVSRRYHRSVAVMFIDLDGFKLVNDSLGHNVGDLLLVEVVGRILKQIRPGDTCARIGGDEFVVVLSDLAHEEDVVLVAERILHAINQQFEINGEEIQLSASIGITLSDGKIEEPMELIQQADNAMYRAKKLGHNTFQWYSKDLNRAVGKTLVLRNQIQKALHSSDFLVYFQPQIDARTGSVVGLEALLRWPQGGDSDFISPSEFIPVAEESGQIVPLSLWVFEQSCLFNKSLQDRKIAELVVTVNVSSTHFQRSNFVSSVEDILKSTGLDPRYLELEITETVLFDNSDLAIHKLKQLKDLGVQISIDDFGTGFSSLNYLKRLPIDKIKIDRSFIQDIISDQHDAAITKGIITMAHLLGLKVIAEGVETKSQVSFLARYFCDEFQGYHFAHPMPSEKVEQYLMDFKSGNDKIDSENQLYKRSILILDDEDNILSALNRLLRKDNLNIYTANNAEKAFEILAMHEIQVVLSDQRMPTMNGTEFLKIVKDLYPETIRMVLSGYTDLRSVTEAINSGAIYKFLTKPWNEQELRNEIKYAFLQHERNSAERRSQADASSK